MNTYQKIYLSLFCLTISLNACKPSVKNDPSPAAPSPTVVGERLFKETRFAQFFAANSNGNINTPLSIGDPVMDLTVNLTTPFPGPFKGQSMNCSSCHLVDQQVEQIGGGMRDYSDFAQRSPIPSRDDGRTLTPRNSPSLVNSTLTRDVALFLHLDGEFKSGDDLVRSTLIGRNFGWLPTERNEAIAQIAKVIREDDGSNLLADEFGGWSYQELLLGTNPQISPTLRLPENFRLDVSLASDEEILDTVAKLISAYVDNLRFSKDNTGAYNTSPYDIFLKKNGLPSQPDNGESEIAYSRRLSDLINNLETPRFLAHSDGEFSIHNQQFLFGNKELQGLKIFMGRGNCVSCHAAPNFTDFKFHNTGVTQKEFDGLHGEGSFLSLSIPDLTTRQADPAAFLPPTENHPQGTGKFLSIPSAENLDTDLGLWNVFANDDIPGPQGELRTLLCDQFSRQIDTCTDANILPLTIAYFKTPSLRDLGDSAPYMHNGQFDELSDVVEHYQIFSEMSRADLVRNDSLELRDVQLTIEDREAVTSFLKALNEDYQ